jgi:uncharacterized protein
MTNAERIRVLLFMAFIGVVYVFAAAIVIRWILRKFKRAALSESLRYVWFRRAVLTLASAGLLCVAYGYFIEPYWLSVTHVRINSPKLPKGARPVRIAHISDLHSDPQPRLEPRLIQAIAAEQPDIIVFTGDSINSPAGLPVFRECLTRLAKIAPTFVVRGNWDVWYWSNLNLFEGTGAQELNGRASLLDIRGTPIWVSGVAVEDERMMDQALGAIPPEAFKVFLYHYPDLIAEAARQKVDLYCAGHTHGGQIALPFYGALVTFSKYGKRYESGLFREGETWLYVNRGLGMEGGHSPRVRFWARPEVTVIEIGPEL